MSKPTHKWMPFYLSDYLQDTWHLTTEQHGAYVLLLAHGWLHDGLPDDDEALAKICRLSRLHWIRKVAPMVRPFFVVAGDGTLRQKRQELERAKAEKTHAQKSLAACAKNTKYFGHKSNGINDKDTAAAQEPDIRQENPPPDSAPVPLPKEESKEEYLATLDTPEEPAPRQPVLLQASLLPEPEPVQSKPRTDGYILWHEGHDILAALTGRDLNVRSQKDRVSALLKNMQNEAGIGQEAVLMDILRRAQAEPPASAVGWIKAAIANRKLRLVASNDPNDAWGIKAWCRAHPDIREATAADKDFTGLQISPTERITLERGFGDWLGGGFFIDKAAQNVARAARLPMDWRGDWSPLMAWLKGGHTPADIVFRIERKLESWSEYRPGSLKAFDGEFPAKRNGRAA